MPAISALKAISQGVAMGASDIHLMADYQPVYRCYGHLVKLPDDPKLSEADIRNLGNRMIQDAAFSQELNRWGQVDRTFSLPDGVRARINLYNRNGSLAAAIRILPGEIPSLAKLGVPKVVSELVMNEGGLLLVSGPSGSGKSTSLASILEFINQRRECHILTLEDPIEYLHRNARAIINQREIGRDTPSFTQGLRSALRQDPDVIMVGEIRDAETLSTALTAAETGHLVMASVHSGTATQTLERMLDIFPPQQQPQARIMIANTLVGIMNQKLIPGRDGRGRVLAAEVLVVNPAVRNMIRSNKIHLIQSAMQAGLSQGMVSMRKAVQKLLEQNKISADTASKVSEQQSLYG